MREQFNSIEFLTVCALLIENRISESMDRRTIKPECACSSSDINKA